MIRRRVGGGITQDSRLVGRDLGVTCPERPRVMAWWEGMHQAAGDADLLRAIERAVAPSALSVERPVLS